MVLNKLNISLLSLLCTLKHFYNGTKEQEKKIVQFLKSTFAGQWWPQHLTNEDSIDQKGF
jgi:hypothetical protein